MTTTLGHGQTVSRLISTPQGDFVVSISSSGVSIRQRRKRKGVSISLAELAQHGLAKHHHLRWPKHLHDKPLEQLTHLSRRHI